MPRHSYEGTQERIDTLNGSKEILTSKRINEPTIESKESKTDIKDTIQVRLQKLEHQRRQL